MIKYIFAAVLVMACMTIAQAQRMLPRQKGLEINVGALSKEKPGQDFYINAAMTVYGKKGNYQLWALEYNHEYTTYKDWKIPLETYLAQAGYSFQLLGDARKTITLNAAITGVIGYETINRGKELLQDGAVINNKEGFVYGAGGRLSLETYLSNRFVLLLQGRTSMLWGTSRDQFRPSAGLGLRINF